MAIRVRDWDSRYVFYSLVGNSSQFEAASTGLIPGLSRSDILGAAITLPPLPEQQAIAQALSDVDQLIASLDQLIEKRRALKTATMQQLLTGKTRLAGFSGEWETKRFIDFAIIDPETLGANTDPNYQFNYISLEDVEKGTLKGFSELDFRSAPSRARRKLSTMDILIATVRPNLQSHLLFSTTTPNWICSTGFAVIRCIQNISCPAFIYQHLFGNTLCAQIATLISGSNYPAISSNDVRALQIPLPSIEEQQAIAEVLSDMDAEIAELEQRRDKTIAIKQGMMQDLLTGRTRLI